MKTLRLYRHSLKDPKNNISEKGLMLAALVGEKTLTSKNISDLFWGILPRTKQTLDALISTSAISTSAISTSAIEHKPLTELGSDKMFTEMVNDEFKKIAPEKGNREAVKSSSSAKKYANWMKITKCGVQKMFSQMTGGFGVGVFHSPTIEIAAEAVDVIKIVRFPEMSYVDFVQDDDGNISVADIWICDVTV